MEQIAIHIYNAQVGDLAKFRELNQYGEISRIYPGAFKFDIHLETGGIIEAVRFQDIEIYREVMEGTELPCMDCNGEGFTESLECFRPASECCGGCYQQYECETCEGTKIIIV